MTTPATPSSPKSGDDRNLVAVDENYIAPTFEDRLRLFWEKNGTIVLVLCGLVLAAILAKGGWDYLQSQKEGEIGRAYAAASTPEQLKAFAAAHPGHSLAGIVQLRLADDAYAAGKSAEALGGYEQAVAAIKAGPLAARAGLGRALAKIQAGKAADGAAELKQISGNASELKGLRAEATYHLASLAAESGTAAEVQTYSEQLMKIDPSSPWAQRAMALRASLPTPAPATVAPSDATPAEVAPTMQIKLPGK